MPPLILLVDDNGTDRLILRSILEHYGCRVLEEADGQGGLEAARLHKPELIISDALMPRMDGYQFLKAAKEDEQIRTVPFVFYTAVYTGGKESKLAASLGAADFLVKPLSAQALWDRLSAILSRATPSENRPPAGALAEDTFLKQYSSIVASKLEEKVLALEREIAERSSAEETIRTQHGELRMLSARLNEAEEQERRRIACELHDQVGQNLTAVSISLNVLRAQLPESRAGAVSARIDDIQKLLEDTAVHVRALMTELRPPLLDDYGLQAAVEWYVKEFSLRTGIPAEVVAAGAPVRFDPGREITLFRVLQEALTNASRHASASKVLVLLEWDAGRFRMSIRDNGSGFDPATGAAGERPTWGLQNMAERARMAGGELRIEGAPGMGTVVVVEIAR